MLLTSTAMIKLVRCDQLSETSKPFTCKTSQESPTLIFYLQYQYIIKKNVMRFNKYHLRENALIFYQILPTNSLRKCIKISLENLYVVIGD